MSEPPTPLSSGPRSLGPATSSPTSPGPPYAPELGNSSSSEAPVPSSKDPGALTSLHIASEVDAVGFLANTAGCLGTRARLMEWYDAGRTLEAILSTVVLGSWGGGWSTRCREMYRPFPQPHNNPGGTAIANGHCIYRSGNRLSGKVLARCYSAQISGR